MSPGTGSKFDKFETPLAIKIKNILRFGHLKRIRLIGKTAITF
jgi:hypothetical protein